MNGRQLFCSLVALVFLLANASCAQPDRYQLVGVCEGCEAVFEYGGRLLNPVDTLPEYESADTKIKVTGVIYKPDGVTPAENVILYVYHTNGGGIYPKRGTEKDWSRMHGYIRGGIKTGVDGRYTFYTSKPGAYPGRKDAAHIHPVILEPEGKYYWVDEFLFEGDSLITPAQREVKAPVGGTSGILQLRRDGNLLVGERDLILGRNVKGYSE